ncbi:MAG: hypothetical protein WAU70_02875 [Flavobacteriales bacterium]
MRRLSTIAMLFLAIGLHAQDGLVQERYPNGKLRSTHYAEGDLVRFVTYYESGRVKEMGGFHEGLREGAWKQFAENGTVLCEALFAKGKRQGNWTVHNIMDSTTGRLHFSDGTLAYAEQLDADGGLIASRTY